MSLRNCRESIDLSISEVAKKIGVDRRTYYLWESQNKDIPSSMLIKLAELFGCSINELLDYYPETKSYQENIEEIKFHLEEATKLIKKIVK